MRAMCHRNTALNKALLLYWTMSFVPCLVLSITVNSPAELHASKGDTVTLPCTFTSTSRPTSKLSVDWSYKPQTGGPSKTFFYFVSRVFLPTMGQFEGRIKWQGSPARGDVSISLINATLNDNGTYTCSVKNPPDVHGFPTSHSVLTVTSKDESTTMVSPRDESTTLKFTQFEENFVPRDESTTLKFTQFEENFVPRDESTTMVSPRDESTTQRFTQFEESFVPRDESTTMKVSPRDEPTTLKFTQFENFVPRGDAVKHASSLLLVLLSFLVLFLRD